MAMDSYSKPSMPESEGAATASRLPGRGRGPAAQPQRQDPPERLEHDPGAHLRVADLAVAEADRDLAHPGAGADGAVGQLDLEAEAGGVEAGRAQVLEQLAPEALEAAGQVPYRHPQDGPRVPGAAAAEQAAREPPVGHPAAGDVARAQHE